MRFEDKIMELYRRIESRYKYTFFSVIIWGLCSHLYQFTNKIPNFDEYGQTPAGLGATLELGRWGLELLGKFTGLFYGWFSFPLVNGLITLLLVAFSACIIVSCLAIKDRLVCILLGAICATFPALTSTYFFMFTAPYYGVALFLACLSAWIMLKGHGVDSIRKRILTGILSAVILTLSMGIYQAYVSMTICILLIDVILRFFRADEKNKDIIIDGVCDCVVIALGTVFYFIIMKCVNAYFSVEFGGYRNLGAMTEVTLGTMYYSLKSVYRSLLFLPTSNSVMQINYSLPVRFTFCVCFAFILFGLIKNLFDRNKSLISGLFAILGAIILPIGIFFPFVLVQVGDGSVYTLMIYSGVFLFIFPLTLCENIFCDSVVAKMPNKAIGWVLLASVFMCSISYFWYDNANYQGLQYTHYHDLAYYETLMTQVKSLDGYSDDMSVAILGEFNDHSAEAGSLMEYYFNIGGKFETNINYKDKGFIWYAYLGFTPTLIDDEGALQELANREEIMEMPCYPMTGSIRIVDDVVVIKASEISDRGE